VAASSMFLASTILSIGVSREQLSTATKAAAPGASDPDRAAGADLGVLGSDGCPGDADCLGGWPSAGGTFGVVRSDGRGAELADDSDPHASGGLGGDGVSDSTGAGVELDEAGVQCDHERCHVAGTPWTDADVRAALVGRSVMVRRIIFCEVGRSGEYRPYAVGSLGEIGPAQLLPGRGNGLSIFYGWNFTEPNNPWQAVAFIERVEREGMLRSQYPRTMLGCAGSV
jgi:hypothetical protein